MSTIILVAAAFLHPPLFPSASILHGMKSLICTLPGFVAFCRLLEPMKWSHFIVLHTVSSGPVQPTDELLVEVWDKDTFAFNGSCLCLNGNLFSSSARGLPFHLRRHCASPSRIVCLARDDPVARRDSP